MSLEPGSHTYREILSQDEAWSATLESTQALPSDLVSWLQQPRDEALFTGCGSTYYLSHSAAAIWQALTGIRARAVPASELWLFPESTLPVQPALLVAVSRSGETTETIKAVHVYRQQSGEPNLLITCYPDREMVKDSPYTLIARQAEEQSVAQTRSFSSMFLLAQVTAGVASGRTEYLERLRSLPQAFRRIVKEYEPLAKKLAGDSQLQHIVFLGSGANYGLANEGMLKMKEMSLTVTEAFHFLEFRHGPKSMVTPATLIVGMLSEGSAREQELKVLAEMRELGATVLAIDESAAGLDADYTVELQSGLGYLERGALLLPVPQLLAYHRAVEKGLNPDRPANLDTVVKL